MEFFLKYQQVILRSLGGFLLLIGFIVHFWTVPQEGISQNDRAAANLAIVLSKRRNIESKGTLYWIKWLLLVLRY
ncbi:MAG: hypothetical protein SPLUMA2_SPLUMAMAG2_00371 [uncultured Sulfurimonas sp.]|nr:MAG: hypothetical protein SPLUMA1_SPLUMAMAG1_00304 [uncultured Sulfurimonas sp.]CAI6153352.1 MAG: hypothetical protein SPLUMA2_SPLUMAMAG2_00371 [uncultured Sulfurimonas sp.]